MLYIRLQLPTGLRDAKRILSEEFVRGMNQSTAQIEQEAKKLVRVRTGNLRRAIVSDVVPLGSTVRGLVYPNMKQASYASDVEFGTGIYHEPDARQPWVVKPKNKRALAFKIGGEQVIVKQVTIQGTRPHPYMRPAFDRGKEIAQENIRAAVQRARERMAK